MLLLEILWHAVVRIEFRFYLKIDAEALADRVLLKEWITCKSSLCSTVACTGFSRNISLNINRCTVYDINNRDTTGNAKIVRELLGYEGFLSSCRFLDDNHILTGSGDMKLCIWDLEAAKKTSEVVAHGGDVVSISLSPDGNQFLYYPPKIFHPQTNFTGNQFVTGSVDRTCKLPEF